MKTVSPMPSLAAFLTKRYSSTARKRKRMKKPTIVFVPGAWHPPTAYDLLLPPLHAAGYTTTYVYLPSVGAAAPVAFEDDVAAVRRVVAGLVELGREVVVVSHSYGASPATEALRGLGKNARGTKELVGGVIQLVYIAAIVPTKDASAVDAFGPMKPKEEGGSWIVSNDLGVSFGVYQDRYAGNRSTRAGLCQ
jgi:pimeloyl-ACP methyl ester carboxylesterase